MKRRTIVLSAVTLALPIVFLGCRLLPITEMSPPLTQLSLADKEAGGNWTPQSDMTVYIGTQLYDFNDGGAPPYLEKGCIRTGVQVFDDPNNGTLVNSIIMDFGTDSNAVSMFNEKKIQNAGQTIKDPQYPDSVAFMVLVLGGVQGYGHYKNYYFEISPTGFSDNTLAIQTFDQFFTLYRNKVDSR